ncbi:MAG: methionine--tRNA ligase [Candidatus Wallbacteria bacterium]|nr:methionine--tRNA ligase [Candidatus Wallbacteria bacterium]
MKERLLVTSALPYANGPIHFGHIAGAYLPADIFVRFKRLNGADIVFICGTDEHGVPITLSAEKDQISPKEYVDKYHKVIKGIFDKFNIRFDSFGRTTHPDHYDLTQEFFMNLLKKNLIKPSMAKQYFCASCNKFLADRYVKGTCPKCGHNKARGDECTSCGSWLDVLELKEPSCGICSSVPELRETKHWYLQLQDMSAQLDQWLSEKKHWKENVITWVRSMIKEGLKERAITRDLSWGVPLPLDNTEGKVLYVWFDAPIGYISITKQWARDIGKPDEWKKYWLDPSCRVMHFIGKDNIPFHCIVWPALLMGQVEGYNMPYDVPANEFFNLDGRQFSKSDGWYIDIEDFFTRYKTDSIRYAIAANAPETRDSDFTWKDFQGRNNSELANIYGNFVHRTLAFIIKYFDETIPQQPAKLSEPALKAREEAHRLIDEISSCYNNYEARKACFLIMEMGRLGNRYYDSEAPWATRKSNPDRCAETIGFCTELISYLAYVSYPVIPESAAKLWRMLGNMTEIDMIPWDRIKTIRPAGFKLKNVAILFEKIEDEQIQAEIDTLLKNCEKAGGVKPASPAASTAAPASGPVVNIDDFRKLDLRIAKILEAEALPKSDKLLKLRVSVGGETRQLIAGIAKHYQPQQLIGKNVVIVANLKPAKLMGEVSQGMVLAAKNGDVLALLGPDADISDGSQVS